MDPILAGSAISAGAGLLSNAINGYQVNKQNEQNQRNWREQNEYNKPINQRKRMEEAGFNPALMVGGGTGSSGNASPQAPVQRREVDLSSMANVVNTYLDLKQKDANIENTRENTVGQSIGNAMKWRDEKAQAYEFGETPKDEIFGKSIRKRSIDKTYEQLQNNVDTQKIDQEVKGTQADSNRANIRNTEQRTQLSKILQWLPEAEKAAYEQFGVYPNDSDEYKAIKILYKQSTGNKLDDTSGKGNPASSLMKLISLKTAGTTAAKALKKKSIKEAQDELNVKDYDKWRKSMGDVWDE